MRLRGVDERIGIVDGAVCLKANLDELRLEWVLLDFYHASEHVGQAAMQTDTAEGWLQRTLHVLRHEGYGPRPGTLPEAECD